MTVPRRVALGSASPVRGSTENVLRGLRISQNVEAGVIRTGSWEILQHP